MTEKLPPAPSRPPVPPEDLRWHCPPESLPFETTADLPANQTIIGQDRAMEALSLGLGMDSPGYNIFLAGFVGTGRATAIRHVLQKLDRAQTPPPDLCFVHDFSSPLTPRPLFLPAGKGRILRDGMSAAIHGLRRDIPHALESEACRAELKRIVEKYQAGQQQTLREFQGSVEAEGFALIQVQMGTATNPDIAPVVDGEPRSFADLEERVEKGQMDAARVKELREKREALAGGLRTMVQTLMRGDREMNARVAEQRARSIRPIVTAQMDALHEDHEGNAGVLGHLDDVEAHIIAHLDSFARPEEGEGAPRPDRRDETATRYAVNLLVDPHDTDAAPVVMEHSPTARHLFGMLERGPEGELDGAPSHLHIRPGALHRAHGGYLVIHATDLFQEPGSVWNALKRTLRTSELEIHVSDASDLTAPPGLKPQAVPIRVKVVLIGDAHLYHGLYALDEDFKKVFKIRADFDTEMTNTTDHVRHYGEFVQRLVADEGIPPFDRAGLAAVAEYGARLAGRKDRLSTRFHLIADLVREAAHFARSAGKDLVTVDHVSRAMSAKDYRNNLSEEKMVELIQEGSIFIDMADTKVGQVNGLAVYESGEHAFGVPARITATVALGSAGIINIEREAELSGHTHDKGVQILSGFLRARYAQDKPMSLSASICFEQSYHGVDGDSASSTELFALMSALSGIPIRQEIAITGSVNQRGEIQPIGGVNEKIEGFFHICKGAGLTGTQGVLIPASNVADLMLAQEVVQAVRDGLFHVHAVSNIDEGIELLTGVAAGERSGKRRYPAHTVNGKVDDRLRRLALQLREFGGHS
ncbi:MAG: ATP-dependent protease [Gemmatimonadetes bacterium]|nr:ATP-dependent protease [Gemmatimonadota bacterium]